MLFPPPEQVFLSKFLHGPFLFTRQIDMFFCGKYITPARSLIFDFTMPYLSSGYQVVLVHNIPGMVAKDRVLNIGLLKYS